MYMQFMIYINNTVVYLNRENGKEIGNPTTDNRSRTRDIV